MRTDVHVAGQAVLAVILADVESSLKFKFPQLEIPLSEEVLAIHGSLRISFYLVPQLRWYTGMGTVNAANVMLLIYGNWMKKL